LNVSEDLEQVKKCKMNRVTIKDLIYGGVNELMKNRNYYYSSAGSNYAHWTEEGKEELLNFVILMSKNIAEAEIQELDKRAKAMVLKELKGE